MKKLKNAVYILVVLLMIGTVLVGCATGGSNDTKKDRTETRENRESQESTETQETTENQVSTEGNETETITPENGADANVQSVDAFLNDLRCSQGEAGETIRLEYQNLTFVRYYDVDMPTYAHQYQVWYQGKLIAGPEAMINEDGECLALPWTNYYAVTYKNSVAFVVISLVTPVGDCAYFDIRVFDTNGNVLYWGFACGAPAFDTETATLTYSVLVSNPNEDPDDPFDDDLAELRSISLKNSLDGEAMIAVKEAPDNVDLSIYE